MFVVTDTGSKVNDCTRHLCVCKCACMCMFVFVLVFVCVCVCVCVFTLSYYILLSIFLRFQSNFGVSVSTCMLGLSLILGLPLKFGIGRYMYALCSILKQKQSYFPYTVVLASSRNIILLLVRYPFHMICNMWLVN